MDVSNFDFKNIINIAAMQECVSRILNFSNKILFLFYEFVIL